MNKSRVIRFYDTTKIADKLFLYKATISGFDKLKMGEDIYIDMTDLKVLDNPDIMKFNTATLSLISMPKLPATMIGNALTLYDVVLKEDNFSKVNFQVNSLTIISDKKDLKKYDGTNESLNKNYKKKISEQDTCFYIVYKLDN